MPLLKKRIKILLNLSLGFASAQQIKNENYHRRYYQQMNQATRGMQSEPQ